MILAAFVAASAAPSQNWVPLWQLDAQATVAARLKDPDSAKFENWHRTGKAVCGLVNSKNGFGGYMGAQSFVVLPAPSGVGSDVVFEKDGADAAATILKFCY